MTATVGPETVAGAPSLFGYEVRAPRALTLLRPGGGVGILQVARGTDRFNAPAEPPIMAWAAPDSTTRAAALYRTRSGFRLCTPTEVCDIEPSRATITLSNFGPRAIWEERFAGIPTLLCFLTRGDVPLHAAAVEVNGRALLFAAPGRRGKTTLALAFHRSGFRVLTEDLACCRPGPVPVVLPGPALLRVRPDVLREVPDGLRIVAQSSERIYLSIDPARRGTGAPVPISGIVLLEAADGRVALSRVRAGPAMRALWTLSFNVPGASSQTLLFHRLASMVRHVPVWTLRRPLREDALAKSVETLRDVAGGSAWCSTGVAATTA